MKIIFYAAVLFLFAMPCFSTAATTQASWSQFFDGDSSQASVDFKCEADYGGTCEKPVPGHPPTFKKTGRPLPFRNWIRGYQRCAKEVDQIFSLVEKYDRAFVKDHDSTQSKNVFGEISAFLESQKSAGQCAEVVKRGYWIAILNLGPDDRFLLPKNDLVLFGIFLTNLDAMTRLTPVDRQQMSDSPESLWNQKLSNGDYELSGTYNCEAGHVSVSSDLLPYNLLGSLMHEMDHLYRDKLAYKRMKSWVESMDVQSFIVTDEMVSAIYGTTTQLNYRASGADPGPQTINDFNLFSPKGALETIFKLIPMDPPVDFSEAYGYMGYARDQPAFHKELCRLDATIRKGYFNQKQKCDLKDLFPHAVYVSLGSYVAGVIQQLRENPYRLGELLDELTEFKEGFVAPTQVCTRLIEAEKSGALENYIGLKLKGPLTKPGNTGIKPCLRKQL